MIRISLLVVAAVAWFALNAVAGIYNTAEQDAALNPDFFIFRDKTLIPLRQLGSPETHTVLNRRYQMMATRLSRAGNLSVEDRLNLGAYLIRFRKYRDAVEVLRPAQQQDRDNFLVLANLATAEQLDGQLGRAEGWLRAALDPRVWPEKFEALPEAKRKWFNQIGWSEEPYGWYRSVEKYHHELLKLRTREPPTTGLPQAPDALFGPIQFVGEGGKFQPGKLDFAQKQKLPKNAIAIVQQLLIWLPEDMRLYWLLGELYNADGKIEEAREILEEIDRKWNPKAALDKGLQGFQRRGNPKVFQEHLDALKAHPRTPVVDIVDPPIKPPPEEPVRSPFDWRAFGVGIMAGLVLALFGFFQIREIRRRRQSRAGVK